VAEGGFYGDHYFFPGKINLLVFELVRGFLKKKPLYNFAIYQK